MDSINSNPYFNPSRLAQTYQKAGNPAQVSKSSNPIEASSSANNAASSTQKVETFSTLFDDSELERLQNNLESIANLAETALKRFSDKPRHF